MMKRARAVRVRFDGAALTTTMAIRMGYWDCPGCGRKRIDGPERGCPECGRPRDPQVQFYTDDEAPSVEDPALIARAHTGADWTCPYCGADNPRGSTSCEGCGATQEGAKSRQERIMIAGEPKAPAAQASAGPKVQVPDSAAPLAGPVASPRSSGKRLLACVALVLALILAAAYALFIRTKPLTVTVTKATWVKSLKIERLETQLREAWRDEVPSGAREVRRSNAQRTKHVQVGTERVKVGKKDLGNGFFEDVYADRPKYEDRTFQDTRVSYEIDRWVDAGTLKNEATDGTEPEYPSFVPSSKQRVARRDSEIVLALEGDNGKSYAYTLKLGDDPAMRGQLAAFGPGKTLVARVNAVGAVLKLEP